MNFTTIFARRVCLFPTCLLYFFFYFFVRKFAYKGTCKYIFKAWNYTKTSMVFFIIQCCWYAIISIIYMTFLIIVYVNFQISWTATKSFAFCYYKITFEFNFHRMQISAPDESKRVYNFSGVWDNNFI